MFIVGDKKIEYLSDDFYGPGMTPNDADPDLRCDSAMPSRSLPWAVPV